MNPPLPPLDRRTFLARLAQGGALVALNPATRAQAVPPGESLIVRSTRPPNLETPVGLLKDFITPNRLFFVRSNSVPPVVDASSYRLVVDGEVEQPLSLSLEELRHLSTVSAAATLQCAGNGRGFYRPRVPGSQWGHGAIGTAEWTGVRLRDLLASAGLKPTARHVAFDGADQGLGGPGVPDFVRSIPIEKALEPGTVLAHAMNGEPLPQAHGFPLRSVVPGWVGAAWVKWLTRITVLAEPYRGYFMEDAYRVPTEPVTPGASVPPERLVSATAFPVMSFFTGPLEGARVPSGPVVVTGVAYAGEADVRLVEVSSDGGRTWRPASLVGAGRRGAWRLWRFVWRPPGQGRSTLMARATDALGRVQPAEQRWNPSGYFYDAIESISLEVLP